MSPSPLEPRYGHNAVWTGTELIVWGGTADQAFSDGAAYDPASDTWRVIATGPLARRFGATAAWTGSEMLVWGGGVPETTFADGALYNPVTDTWRKVSDAPGGRAGAAGDWVDSSFVVWGGTGPGDRALLDDGLRYDPVTDKWATFGGGPLAARFGHSAIAVDDRLFVWGGQPDDGDPFADGAFYEPAADTWTSLPLAPDGRVFHATAASGQSIVVFGGLDAVGGTAQADVMSFDVGSNSWSSPEPAPSATPGSTPSPVATPTDIGGPITITCAGPVVPGHCLQPVAWAVAQLPPGLAAVASVSISELDLCAASTPAASACFPLHYGEWWAQFKLRDGNDVGMWADNSFGVDELKSVDAGATTPPNAEPVSGSFSLVCGSVPDRACTGAAGGSTGLSPNKPPQAVQVAPLAGTGHYEVTLLFEDGTTSLVEVAPDDHVSYGWSAVRVLQP